MRQRGTLAAILFLLEIVVELPIALGHLLLAELITLLLLLQDEQQVFLPVALQIPRNLRLTRLHPRIPKLSQLIDSIDVITAMTVISEAGWDMSKWQTENHFVSWLRLCPDNRISGNKVIGKGRLPTNNPISIALKLAASTLRLSKTYLGAQFRRSRTRLGAPIAIKAMAAKLARLVYRMLRYGMKYVDQGAAFCEAQHRLSQIKQLKWKAHKLGFQIVQTPAA